MSEGVKMSNAIKRTFDEECGRLEIDKALLKRLSKYNTDFVNKNQNHIEFFGGNTVGVQTVRFTDADRDRWFDEILEVDEGPLDDKLIALPTVNRDWHISSDAMNLSCIWLSQAIFNSKHLSAKEKADGMVDVFCILQYKYITSILFNFFKYPADKAIAEATYAQLSFKYAIKIYGSWSALIKARAEEIISETGIHYRTVTKMDIDDDVIKAVNDIQGRIKDIVKNICAVFHSVKQQGIKVTTTSAVMTDHDGQEILKDKSRSAIAYSRYMHSIVTDKTSFIKQELVTVIENMMHTMPPKLFIDALEWMSDNYSQNGAGIIEEVLDETMLHTLDYLSHNRDLIKKDSDLALILVKLRGVYMSSRSTDESLQQLREKTEKIVSISTGNKNESVISSVRTGVMLYIVLRALTMKYYTSV